jgi:5-amino-6-(5-phosphoribosylamino)uracil reductase
VKIVTNTAISLDGKINTQGHSLKNFGSKNDLKRLLQIRNLADAILVGGHTFRNYPHPSLSENLIKGKSKKPIWNIVLTRDHKFNFSEKFLSEQRVKKMVITGKKITVRTIVQKLEKLGVRVLLIEGGGDIISQFLKVNLIDEMYVTLCPLIIGNSKAPSIVKKLNAVRKLKILSREVIGDEIFFHYKVK